MSNSGSIFDAESQSEASDSVSESSEKSSALSYDLSGSRGRRRKRTTTEKLPSSHSRSKRLKSLYNDDYRTLFNATVDEIVSKRPSDNLFQESQIGVTVWSSEEKAAFFRALASRGRHDIRGIASDIRTKSESEVEVYSDMLYKAAIDQQVHRARKNLLDTSYLEAALELQGDCCTALDLTAEALSALQQTDEERLEKKKHKDFAILTPKIARRIERCMVVPEVDKEGLTHRIPAATLLHLMNFLALSRRLFMNSVITEDNWRSYIGRKAKSPSIMYTAFSDFYTLVISITERLVQSSMYFAMSRLRAVSASGLYTPGSLVRRRDVQAAISVLGIETDARVFWARTARKCRLRVYEHVRHRQVFGKRYSYVELEKILSKSMTSDPDSREMLNKDVSISTSRRGRTLTDLSVSASDDSVSSSSMTIDGAGSSVLSNDEELSATSLQSRTDQDHKQEGHDGLRNAYAEALDQQAGRNEERRLWEMLGEDPTEKMEPLDVKLLKRPLPDRKNGIELLDWRNSANYAGDWETYEPPVFGSNFAISGRFNPDVDLAAGLTSSGSSSGESITDATTETEHGSDSNEVADRDDATKDNIAHALSAEEDE